MILGVILYSALICALSAFIRFSRFSSSSKLIQCIRFQLECIYDLSRKWIAYLITIVPVLIVMALASQSNHVIMSLEILYLLSLMLLVLFHRIKQSRIFSARLCLNN